MVLICKHCRKEITIEQVFPGGWYARCNTCCSLMEGSKNYVYNHLGHNKCTAIRVILESGNALEVDDEVYRKECLSKEPTVDSVFGSFPAKQGS